MPQNKKTVTFTNNATGESVEFPILESNSGPHVVDIRKFYASTNMFTYDPGFTSTASCKSSITFIDGKKILLLHRGYAIQELVEKSTYMEVCYLLLHGDLPTETQLESFTKDFKNHTLIQDQMHYFFRGFRRDAHPMAMLDGCFSAMSAFYHKDLNIFEKEQRRLASMRIIAKMPTLAAMVYKYSIGQPFVYPKNSLDYAENFLHMMFSVPTEAYHIKPLVAKIIDTLFILHADHEQNASTSTVRTAASSESDPFACVGAGITSLWGPAHGGANEAVLDMLHTIALPKNIPHFIKRAKDKKDPFRLMGFGHRVYKNFDPRAISLKHHCRDVLHVLGKIDDPIFQLALELERIALQDEYFIERKLFPNVDFYSGIILSAIGFPKSMFTVLFATARTIGWVAQWNEMLDDPDRKISRPRQLYCGENKRPFVDRKRR